MGTQNNHVLHVRDDMKDARIQLDGGTHTCRDPCVDKRYGVGSVVQRSIRLNRQTATVCQGQGRSIAEERIAGSERLGYRNCS